ncbi:Uncharacterised protein [Mycobacterium tuberculosis]|uniref:Uncharacterized protein n=1 Tax=Mycobacterium tuberculosis TaxID=1773 RepID=A0A655IQX8_MYCTX|nr:Uncharacterised protein [Mycobacterium tuberculosis]COW88664.1 Uncharacterised protein [Mycobacterium tuberculosis]COX82353.1 Uncharacterised protein [Mycobacterium tuberculosis]COZ58884.1 Uncharacterised protein [Mycobacterium tuberculosis]
MEDLYEQCSLHITEYMASSVSVGRRPRIWRIRRYSSSLRPSSPYGCGWSGVVAACSTVSSTDVLRGVRASGDITEAV